MSMQLTARGMRASFVLAAALSLSAFVRAQDAIVPDDFATIQGAVNGAVDADGDGTIEIFVRAGTYHENVLVQRSRLSLAGESAATTTIQGSGLVDTLRVERANRVEISGFLVTNTGTADGIEFQRVRFGSIHDCVTSGNRDGITINRNDSTHVFHNLSRQNTDTGIQVAGSLNCVVDSNVSQQNGSHGFRLRASTATVLSSNSSTGNVQDGYRVENASGSELSNNTASQNLQSGLRIRDTSNNLFSQNTLVQNGQWGIRTRDSVGDDFDGSAAGVQGPIGDNTVAGNANGALRQD